MNYLYFNFGGSLSVDIVHCIDLSFNNKKVKIKR